MAGVTNKKCQMCNGDLIDNSNKKKDAPKIQTEVNRCKKCKDCKDCLKQQTNAIGLQISKEDLEQYKQMFMMFDKVGPYKVNFNNCN